MSLLVVILLVSVATVISYAVLRTQTMAIRIQENADLRAAARQAAVSGLTYGIHQMHSADWTGVDTSETRAIAGHERFTVSYAAGDPTLGPGDADYSDYPYRVAVTSTGYAEDPEDTSRVASYSVRAVLRLIPRALSTWSDWPANHADWPTDWYKMDEYSVYQTKKEETKLDVPCQLAGNVRLQGKLNLAPNYPSAYNQYPFRYYMMGLKQMVDKGYPDYRPISGDIWLPYSEQSLTYFYYLYYYLQFGRHDKAVDEVSSDWTNYDNLTTYQIYPGGPVYDIEAFSDANQTGANLGPDPLTNPLGLFYRDTNMTLQGNVAVNGTLFCHGDLSLQGTAQFTPVTLPSLYGSDKPVKLPTLTSHKLTVKPGSATTIAGVTAVFDEFKVETSSVTLPFSIIGKLIAKKITVDKRQPWDTADWDDLVTTYRYEGTSTTFPQWLVNYGYNPCPNIKVSPDSTPVLYHWNNWDAPIFVPHDDDDGGLRWALLRWQEGSDVGPIIMPE